MPSASESLANTPPVVTDRVVSSAVVYESSTATGASFTAFTVIVKVATFESVVPSFAV